jgi:3-methyladenine DNA glycosylase AlkD
VPRRASLLSTLHRELSRVADPKRAPAMQAYMKSTMPYLGVSAVPMRQACRRVFTSAAFSSRAVWAREVLSVWRGARFREERYAAIELTGHKVSRPFQTLASLPLYEEIIVTGAWWDYVDAVAAHRIGPLLSAYPAPMERTMLRWSRDEDMWKRRSAIISQITFKGATNLALLYACIEPSLSSREFFLRKAIGWALRSYAWTDPGEVVRYVRAHDGELSPLSKREALKNVAGRAR